MKTKTRYLDPWIEIVEYAENLETEARKEISSRHPLWDVGISALAQHRYRDDVLFELHGAQHQYAVLHLTWRGEVEIDPMFPETRLFASFEDWAQRCMTPDHEESRSV